MCLASARRPWRILVIKSMYPLFTRQGSSVGFEQRFVIRHHGQIQILASRDGSISDFPTRRVNDNIIDNFNLKSRKLHTRGNPTKELHNNSCKLQGGWGGGVDGICPEFVVNVRHIGHNPQTTCAALPINPNVLDAIGITLSETSLSHRFARCAPDLSALFLSNC